MSLKCFGRGIGVWLLMLTWIKINTSEGGTSLFLSNEQGSSATSNDPQQWGTWLSNGSEGMADKGRNWALLARSRKTCKEGEERNLGNRFPRQKMQCAWWLDLRGRFAHLGYWTRDLVSGVFEPGRAELCQVALEATAWSLRLILYEMGNWHLI